MQPFYQSWDEFQIWPILHLEIMLYEKAEILLWYEQELQHNVFSVLLQDTHMHFHEFHVILRDEVELDRYLQLVRIAPVPV
jgi:hypothetical protein